jgi:phage terminase Nu1 subunit (DNA packaging protein)
VNRELVLTRSELAAALKVSVRTVDRLSIPSVKVGRRRVYRVEDVQDYLQEHAA